MAEDVAPRRHRRFGAAGAGLVAVALAVVGYWLVASDGGIFAFEALFRGSMGGTTLNKPVTGMVTFGDAYLMVASDSGTFNFSTLPFYGSLGANPPPYDIKSIAAFDESRPAVGLCGTTSSPGMPAFMC